MDVRREILTGENLMSAVLMASFMRKLNILRAFLAFAYPFQHDAKRYGFPR
jgi:hypothetical protein